MRELMNLKIGQPIFWKRKNMFVYYIAFWPKLNNIIYSYDLFSMKRYEDIPYSIFYNEFLTDKNEIESYIHKMIEDEKKKSYISIPEKVNRKMDLLLKQQECMMKLNKPLEDLKKGQRNIKRQQKKIQSYSDRNEQIKKDIDYKYIGLLEEFDYFF